MAAEIPCVAVEVTNAAQREAAWNCEANLRALWRSQPRVAQMAKRGEGDDEWVYGRDGALTARVGGRWAAGCSLPRRAAEAILKDVDLKGAMACLVGATHAQQVQVVLDRLGPEQALTVIEPDMGTLRLMLHCCDWSDTVARGRLWFAAGEAWEAELGKLFVENGGLSLPQQITRTSLIEHAALDAQIAAAKRVFADETTRRTKCAGELRTGWKRSGKKRAVAVIAPSIFRLWDDAGAVLAEALACRTAVPAVLGRGYAAVGSGDRLEACPTIGDKREACPTIRRMDPDRPTEASSFHLAQLLAECDGLVTANMGRADLPAVVPDEMPVVTWITGGRVPAYDGAHPCDGLVLADESFRGAAKAAGWPDQRVAIGGWPYASLAPGLRGEGLAVIADTSPLEIPKEFDYSSHRLLWELIEHEIKVDPFVLPPNVGEYLDGRMKRLSIGNEGLDRRMLIERLVVPAYQQGLVRVLLGAGAQVRLFGRGWEQVADLAAHACGEIRSRRELAEAAQSAGGLAHVWPARHRHPSDSLGRPVLRRAGGRREWLAGARELLAGRGTPSDNPIGAVRWEVVERLLP